MLPPVDRTVCMHTDHPPMAEYRWHIAGGRYLVSGHHDCDLTTGLVGWAIAVPYLGRTLLCTWSYTFFALGLLQPPLGALLLLWLLVLRLDLDLALTL